MIKEQDLPYDIVIDERPWGKFTQFSHNQNTTVKIIEVNPQEQLSTQRHRFRDELWVALDEGLVTKIDDKESFLSKGQVVFVPRKTIHTIRNNRKLEKARFLEVAFGHFDEGDIERLEDRYGRK